MTTVAELNYQRKQAGLPLIRFDLRQLRAEDIQELREAYAAMYEISDIAVGDSRGYTALARGHGYDQDLCHRNSRLFLTWHRAYVYYFEKALNTALQWKRGTSELELTLPYWDWTRYDPATDAPNGVPVVLDQAVYQDASGASKDNPLFSAKSLYREVSQGLTGDARYTKRYPNRLLQIIPTLADDVARYLSNPSYISFSNDFNSGAHGDVHVYTGGESKDSPLRDNLGDLASVVSAAYDPIFWIHHSMVDKVWADWQVKNPNAVVPKDVLGASIYGGLIGEQVIDAEASLHYVYSEDSIDAAIEAFGTVDEKVDLTAFRALEDSNPALETLLKPFTVSATQVTGPFSRAHLEFAQLRPPRNSYEIRAYLNNPDCDEHTGLNDSSYVGRITLFGHGYCHGAKGHCDPSKTIRDEYDIRPKHYLRYQHTEFNLDVTRGLRRHMNNQPQIDNITFYLVTLDHQGKQVPNGAVKFRGCVLRTF